MFEWIRPIPRVFLGVGIFFASIVALYFLEKFEILDSYPRKGFLPVVSTPGLRFFVGVVVLIYIYLIGLAVVPSYQLVTFLIGIITLIIIMIWG